MKPILILQHKTLDSPGYLTTWLEKHHIDYIVIDGETINFPDSIAPYSALAVLGGSMSVNDPLLSNRQAEILILQAILRDIPVIGHCLGGQLLAKALGATVSKSYKPEIGWQPIQYANSAESIKWFGKNPTPAVMHWHYESFSIPEGATLLATSDACYNQAFSYGKHLAMQFHIEIDSNKAITWANDIDPLWDEAKATYNSVQDKNEILEGISVHIDKHQQTGDNVYRTWLSTTEWQNKLQN